MFGVSTRLEDYMRAQERRDAAARDEHREMRDAAREDANKLWGAVKDLSEQTRGEFASVREAVEKRHAENKRQAIAIMLAVFVAILTSYLAHTGLALPGLHP